MLNRKEAKENLKAAAAGLLPLIQAALAQAPEEAASVKVEDMYFSKEYLREIIPILNFILEEQQENRKARCQALCDMISLEMVANSKLWGELRYNARLLT